MKTDPAQQEQPAVRTQQLDGKDFVVLRGVAFLADYLVFLAFFFGTALLFGVTGVKNDQEKLYLQDLWALVVILAWIVWFPVVEMIRGRSYGKSLVGLTIVATGGELPRWPALLIRRLLDPIEILCCPAHAFIFIVSTKRGQRLGDLLAKTVVVERSKVEETSEG